MRRFRYLIAFFIGAIFFASSVSGVVNAASLSFDQPTLSATAGTTFDIKVNIDGGTDQLRSTDAYILYDQNLLEADSVTDDTYFPTVTHNITPGKVYIAGLIDDPNIPSSGSGTIATITFKPLANGTANLTFDCQTSSTNTSQILKNDDARTNVIVCAQNGTSAVTIGTGVGNTGTPAASPSALPVTGTFENVMKLAIPGMMLFMLGIVARLAL